MEDILQNPVIWGAVIPFIVEVIKKIFKPSAKMLPEIAFACGLLYGLIEFFVPGGSTSLTEAILWGLATGGIATGLYDVKHSWSKPKKS